MKKAIALGTAMVITGGAVVSCDNPLLSNLTAKNSDFRQTQPEDQKPPKGSNIDFGVQYIRTGSAGSDAEGPAVISSRAELERYFDGFWESSISGSALPEKTAKYTDGFFTNNFLVIVQKTEGSGSVRHEVTGVDETGNIFISRLVPDFGTDDIATWQITVELDNGYKVEKYNAVFNDEGAWLTVPDPVLVPIDPVITDPVPVPIDPVPVPAKGDTSTNKVIGSPPFDIGIQLIQSHAFDDNLINWPVVTAISSRTELDEYYAADPRKDNLRFIKAGERYTDDFFKDYFILVIYFWESSGGTRHRVVRNDDKGDIFIYRTVGMTADVATWNIIIPMNKKYRAEKYNVVFKDETAPPAVPPAGKDTVKAIPPADRDPVTPP